MFGAQKKKATLYACLLLISVIFYSLQINNSRS